MTYANTKFDKTVLNYMTEYNGAAVMSKITIHLGRHSVTKLHSKYSIKLPKL